MTDIQWGPSGQTVYERTYSRKKADGTNETLPETVERVARGNLSLVYGEPETWTPEITNEYVELIDGMMKFQLMPAGRHMWASGVKGRQFLMNCWTSGWGEKLSDHMDFTFLRLMEGGGVGANYSSHHVAKYGLPKRELQVHIVCDPEHADYQKMLDQGLLSPIYDSDWEGAYEIEDSREGWAAGLVDLIDTFMTEDEVKHTARVYDVSRVRHEGARLKTFGGTASGPAPFARMLNEVARILSYAHARYYTVLHVSDATWQIPHLTGLEAMSIDHAIAECVVSGGVRRSARMAMMRWDDPQVFEFIKCKQENGNHYTTNISVEIDQEFIDWLNTPEPAKAARHTLAISVHEASIAAMMSNGEPGYWNSTLSNQGELEPVYTTNPCGEITLAEWEACCLAHVNLDAFSPKNQGDSIDWAAVDRAHELMTRFAIRATFTEFQDEKSREVEHKNRRIGVGHLGVQGFLAKQGIRYSEAPDSYFPADLYALRQMVRQEAHRYAFELRIPEPIKVTTVAPTGTIAKMPGVTEGIHPIFSRYFKRRIRFSKVDDRQWETVLRYIEEGFDVEDCVYDKSGNTVVVTIPTKELLVEQVEALGYDGSIVESAKEIGLERMLAFQAMYQLEYADNAVSFTVNLADGAYSNEDAGRVIQSYLPQLKGTTIMVEVSRPQSPYEEITELEYNLSLAKSVEDSTDEDCATGACPIR